MKPWGKTSKDFSKEAERFEAIESIKNWVGGLQYPSLIEYLKTRQCTVCFKEGAEQFLLGNYGTEVLYDHIFGQGKWAKYYEVHQQHHVEQAFQSGMAAGRELGETGQALSYSGPRQFFEDFLNGMQAVMSPENFRRYQMLTDGEQRPLTGSSSWN